VNDFCASDQLVSYLSVCYVSVMVRAAKSLVSIRRDLERINLKVVFQVPDQSSSVGFGVVFREASEGSKAPLQAFIVDNGYLADNFALIHFSVFSLVLLPPELSRLVSTLIVLNNLFFLVKNQEVFFVENNDLLYFFRVDLDNFRAFILVKHELIWLHEVTKISFLIQCEVLFFNSLL